MDVRRSSSAFGSGVFEKKLPLYPSCRELCWSGVPGPLRNLTGVVKLGAIFID
jgi:hypothetical protein